MSITREDIEKYYIKQKMSTYEIAEKLNSYPNAVRRAIIKFGYPLRDKGTAQSIALNKGRQKHPTKGIGHKQEAKLKISQRLVESWAGLSEDERNERAEAAKERWENMDPQEKIEFQKASRKGIKRASKEGSMLENFLKNELLQNGYYVQFHEKAILPRNKLEVDMIIPDLKTIIEIDGPSHFLPIWGADKLKKTQEADMVKEGLLLSGGYAIIRVACKLKTISEHHKVSLSKQVLDALEQIKHKFPEDGKRLIFLEVI